ncbi:MAG: hypothetical protein ACYC35_28895 [Pirellulales bacterium]
MDTVLSPPDASGKSLAYLRVAMRLDSLSFSREVSPELGATLDEILAAIKQNPPFHDPLVATGDLTVERDGRIILLATYSLEVDDSNFADIDEVFACFDDDTSEKVAFDDDSEEVAAAPAASKA